MQTRTVTSFSLPAGMRSAIYAEAERRGTTPSRVLEAVLLRHLPEFVAEAIRDSFLVAEASDSPDLVRGRVSGPRVVHGTKGELVPQEEW
jgi:hypothetical protein